MQLNLFGKVLRSPEGSMIKGVSFTPGLLQSAADRYIRRVGRPRKEWIKSVLPEALQLVRGNAQVLQQVAQDRELWKRLVQEQVL